MKHLSNWWLVLVCAILNRMRGDHDWVVWLGLPGRSLYYVSIMVGVLTGLLFRSWRAGMAFAAAYFTWGVGPWARWFHLGRLPFGYAREHIPPSMYEAVVWYLSGGSYHVAMFIRHLNVLPGLVLIGYVLNRPRLWWFAPVLSIAIVGAYEFAWQFAPEQPIFVAELCVGMIWGVLIWALSIREYNLEKR